jgi:hypothetical protein
MACLRVRGDRRGYNLLLFKEILAPSSPLKHDRVNLFWIFIVHPLVFGTLLSFTPARLSFPLLRLTCAENHFILHVDP